MRSETSAPVVKKFIVIYHAPKELMEKMKNTPPEEHKKGMEKWMAWAERIGDGLVEMGAPLGGGQKLSQSGSAPSDSDVAGYSILQAEDMAAAKKLLEHHPHLMWDGSCEIEVYEAMPMPE